LTRIAIIEIFVGCSAKCQGYFLLLTGTAALWPRLLVAVPGEELGYHALSLEHFAAKWNHLASQKCGKNKQIERLPGFIRVSAALES
jgi:hypothetical protein